MDVCADLSGGGEPKAARNHFGESGDKTRTLFNEK